MKRLRVNEKSMIERVKMAESDAEREIERVTLKGDSEIEADGKKKKG